MKYLLLSVILIISSCSDKIEKISKNKILVIAHRGASGYLPEHTLESLTLAHSFDADFIEPDVVMTKDDHLIVLHDINLDDTTNVEEVFPNRKRDDNRFYAIDFTLNEIKKLKIRERTKFSNRFPQGKSTFEIPTLIEWIELLQGLNKTRNKKVGIYVEYKDPKFHKNEGKNIENALLDILKKYGYEDKKEQVFIQCFDPDSLKNLNTNFNKVQLLADNSWNMNEIDYDKLMTDKGLKNISKYAVGIGPHFSQVLGKDLVKNAHENNLKVHVYTLRKDNYPKKFMSFLEFKNELLKYNIDGYFSDFPDL